MDIDDILQSYSRAVMHDLRKSTTTSTGELEDYARRHFLPHECLGVFPADVTPARTKHRCIYIQNTSRRATPASTGWPLRGSRVTRTLSLTRSRARRPRPGCPTCAVCAAPRVTSTNPRTTRRTAASSALLSGTCFSGTATTPHCSANFNFKKYRRVSCAPMAQ